VDGGWSGEEVRVEGGANDRSGGGAEAIEGDANGGRVWECDGDGGVCKRLVNRILE